LDEPHDAPIPDPVFHESDQLRLVQRPEEVPKISVQNPVQRLLFERLIQGRQRLMCAASWPCAVREAGKLGLVHGVEDRYGRSLDDLVLDRRDTNRPLPPI